MRVIKQKGYSVMPRLFGTDGIRGKANEYPITPEIALKVGKAVAQIHANKNGIAKAVIGKDTRVSGYMLETALTSGMLSMGMDVLEIGPLPTPAVAHLVRSMGADCGIMITASHNTKEWNGFKLCRKDDVPISGATGIADIQKLVEANNFKAAEKPGTLSHYNIADEYGKFLRGFARMDRKLKIVVDYANAMGSYEIAGIKDLFDIIPMYEELDGNFPNHEANPLHTETLDAIRAKVKETGAEFGAAFDGDADRCGFVDDEGNIIPMDLFTALIAQDSLSEKGTGTATILYDLRSSWSVRECIKEHGGRPLMSRVGHAFIKQQMRENNAVFAGELSGHYYFAENYVAESQGLALLKLANLVCKSGKKVSELVKPLKKYFASGEINSKVADTKPILDAIRKKYSDGHMFELDGISVEYSDWWFNVRSSNTEPLLRLIVEAKDKATMEAKRDELLKLIRG